MGSLEYLIYAHILSVNKSENLHDNLHLKAITTNRTSIRKDEFIFIILYYNQSNHSSPGF